jgi:hypothetical protein
MIDLNICQPKYEIGIPKKEKFWFKFVVRLFGVTTGNYVQSKDTIYFYMCYKKDEKYTAFLVSHEYIHHLLYHFVDEYTSISFDKTSLAKWNVLELGGIEEDSVFL